MMQITEAVAGIHALLSLWFIVLENDDTHAMPLITAKTRLT